MKQNLPVKTPKNLKFLLSLVLHDDPELLQADTGDSSRL